MKLINILILTLALLAFNSQSYAEETKIDCSTIKADNGVKLYEKIRCKMGKEKGEGFGKKIKGFFKKKS